MSTLRGFGKQLHQRCHHCGRLLVPMVNLETGSKVMPYHRKPPAKSDRTIAVPLTGRDAPWCAGGPK